LILYRQLGLCFCSGAFLAESSTRPVGPARTSVDLEALFIGLVNFFSFKGVAMHTKHSFFMLLLATFGCGGGPPIEEEYETKSQPIFFRYWQLWPSPTISVCWEQDGYQTEKALVRAALRDSWEAVSSVRFTGWSRCSEGSMGIRVFLDGAAVTSHSKRGTDLDGEVNGVVLGIVGVEGACDGLSQVDCKKASVVHEFGHALGFAHEHDREDTECPDIAPDTTQADTTLGPYDPHSVLNYCNENWNGHGRLSWWDVNGARALYGPNGRWVDSKLFDASVYLALYPDLRAAYGTNEDNALHHWLTHGVREGRRASAVFDVSYYLASYADLSAAFGTDYPAALNHWLTYGINEARNSSREFSVSHYRYSYTMWSYSNLNAVHHFINTGLPVEGRRGSSSFDVQAYLARYGDLQAAFGTDYKAAFLHWLRNGIAEGRNGAP
jgi:hypothetical protein